jgi:hypothetical protein
MSEKTTNEKTITVPAVTGEEAAAATDRIEQLATKYGISDADLDALFGACAAVYVRNRIVYADGRAPACACAPASDADDGSTCGGSGPCC